MHYTEFSSKIKAKYPEYQDMDDRELAQKIVAKYPNDYSDVTFDEPETKQQSKTTLAPLQPVQAAEAKQPKQTTTVLTGGVKKDVEFDPLYQDVIKNDNLTREQKAAEIQRRGEAERAQIDRDLRNYKIRANIGAGLEIASGLIPLGAGAKIATKGLQLARPIGQQVMTNLAKRGALEGALSGGVFGIGRGLIEDENVAKTAAQDALLGGVTGGLLSGIGTRLGRTGQRIRDIEQRQKTPLSERMSDEALERLTRPETSVSQFGVKPYNTKENVAIARQIQNNINNEEALMSEYRQVYEAAQNKYGSIANLKQQALADLDNNVKYGIQTDALNDYQNLIAYESTVNKGRYIQNNLPSVALSENIAQQVDTPQAQQIVEQVTEQIPVQPTQQAEQAAQTIDNIVPKNVPTVEQQPYNGIIGREIPTEPITPTERLDVIYNENTAKEAQNALKQNIESLKAPKTEKTTISLRYKNRYYKRNIDDPLTKGIQDADAEINSILDEIKKNPEVVNDANKIAEFEQRLTKKVDFNDDELNQSYYTKLYQALNTGDDINQVNRSLDTANELRKSGEIKKSRLAQNADLPPEMRTAIEANPPEYQVLHNRDLIAQAQANVSSNFEGTKNRLFNLKDNLSAQDFEEARQVISRLYNEGNTDEALRLTEQMTQAATKAGRTVQALSLWSRTTPEGAVRQAQKLIDQYNKNKIPKNIQNAVNAVSKDLKTYTNEEAETAFNEWLSKQAQTKEVQQYNQNGDKLALLKAMERYRQRNIRNLERQEQNIISLKQKERVSQQLALEKEEQRAIKALEREEKSRQKRIENIVTKNVKNKSVRKTIIDNINEIDRLGGLTPENIQRLVNKKYGVENLTTNQANDIIQLTQNIQKATTDEEKTVATALLLKYQAELLPASAMDKVKTARNIALLLNLKTFDRNITGNALVAGLEQGLTKPLAAGIDSLMSLRTGERTRSLPQLREYVKGLWEGLLKGGRDAWLGINTRGKVGQRFDLPQRASFNYRNLDRTQLRDVINKNADLKQYLIELGTKGSLAQSIQNRDIRPLWEAAQGTLDIPEKLLNLSLQAPDRAFYEATFNESVANQLRARGLTEPTDEILQNATNEALEAVFQNDSLLSQGILGARRALNYLGGVGDWLIPYAQTPANVVQMSINYSPLGLFKGGITAARGNQRQASLDLARGLVGSGIYGLGALGASNGIISRPQDDYQIRKNYESLGIRPNQINIGDVGISYSQLQPLAAGLSAGAALYDIANGDVNAIDAINNSISTVADLSMLRSLTDTIRTYNDNGPGAALVSAYGGAPSQFVPTLLNQVNAYIDPYQRETYNPNPIVQGLNQAGAKIPFVSQTLPYKYDVTGQRIKKYESEGWGKAFDVFLNPVFVNKRKDDPVMNELASLYERSGEKSGFLPIAEKKIKYRDLKGNMVDKKLTGKELSTYQKELGQVNYALMNRIMQTNLYNNLGDDEKIKLLQSIKNNTKSVVDEKLFGKPNAAKQRMIKRLTEDARQEAIDEVLKEVKKVFPQMTEKYYNEIGG